MKTDKLKNQMLEVVRFGLVAEEPLADTFRRIERRGDIEGFREARRVAITGRLAHRLAKEAGDVRRVDRLWSKAASYVEGRALPPDGALYRRADSAARVWVHSFLKRHGLSNFDHEAGGGANNFGGNGVKELSKAQRAVCEARGDARDKMFRAYARQRLSQIEDLAEVLASSARGERRSKWRGITEEMRRLSAAC